MKLRNWNRADKTLVLPALMAVLVGCGSSSTSEPNNQNNTPQPESNASPTVTLESAAEVQELTSLTVDAQANDSDGSIESYSWKVIEGPELDLSGQTSAKLEVEVPDVSDDVNWILEVTVTDDKGATTSAQVTIKIKRKVGSVSITGIVTDLPIANAQVTVTVGDETFSAQADAQGVYSINIEAGNESDPQLVQLSATSETNQDVKFVSQLSSFSALKAFAGEDGVVDSRENFRVNITNVTTAEFGLFTQAGNILNSAEALDSARSAIDAEKQLTLSALIKLVVDNDDYSLPEGVSSTLDLVDDQATADSFEVEVTAQDPNIIAQTKEAIVADPNLVDADGNSSRPSPDHPLDGAWHLPDQPDWVVIIKDGKWVNIHTMNEEGEEDGYPGYEFGSFTWDPETKAFDVTLEVDNNGIFGFDPDVEHYFEVINNELKLTAIENGEEEKIVFKRLEDINNPLVGAYYDGSFSAGSVVITVFNALGHEILMSHDFHSVSGVAAGTYTYDVVSSKVHSDYYHVDFNIPEAAMDLDPDFVMRPQSNVIQFKDGSDAGAFPRVVNIVEPIQFSEQDVLGKHTFELDVATEKLHPLSLELKEDGSAVVVFSDRTHTGDWELNHGQLVISGYVDEFKYDFGVVITPTQKLTKGFTVRALTYIEPELSDDNDDPNNYGFSLATLVKQ